MRGSASCCLWRRWCCGRRIACLVGPGCLMCPLAAARPRAVRAASFARRVASKPGHAPSPPMGTAARPFGPSGASIPAARLVLLCVGPSCLLLSNFARNSPVTISEFELASLELQRFWAVFKSDRGKLRADLVSPRLCCRPRVPQPGLRILRPPPHRWRVVCCVLPGESVRLPARPYCRSRAPQLGRRGYCASSTFACNSPVTISVFELASLELQRFLALLKVHAIELHAEFLVCVSVVTHGHRSLVQRLPHMMRIRIGCCYLDRL